MAGNGTCQKIFASSDSSVAVEAFQTGPMRKRRLILFFESFSGELFHTPECLQDSRLELTVDVSSVVCRERSLSEKKRQAIARYARDVALDAAQYPHILFRSTKVLQKPLRGFVMQGDLTIRGITRPAKANLALSPMQNERLQIDADAYIRLPDFGIKPPSSFFGLMRVKDQAMAHLLLWTALNSE